MITNPTVFVYMILIIGILSIPIIEWITCFIGGFMSEYRKYKKEKEDDR